MVDDRSIMMEDKGMVLLRNLGEGKMVDEAHEGRYCGLCGGSGGDGGSGRCGSFESKFLDGGGGV